jgi:hypothetical protein
MFFNLKAEALVGLADTGIFLVRREEIILFG